MLYCRTSNVVGVTFVVITDIGVVPPVNSQAGSLGAAVHVEPADILGAAVFVELLFWLLFGFKVVSGLQFVVFVHKLINNKY